MSNTIGQPSLWQQFCASQWSALKLVTAIATVCTATVWAYTILQGPLSFDRQVQLWCVCFATPIVLAIVQGMFGPRAFAIAVLLWGGAILAFAWFCGPWLLGMLHGVRSYTPVPPVHP